MAPMGPRTQAAAAPPQQPVSGIDSVIKERGAQDYWVKRFFAYVIDAIIVYVVVGILAVFLALPFFFMAGIAAMAALIAGVFSVVAGLVIVIYFVVFEVASGATLGKRAMGLIVKSKAGQNPNFVEAFMRNISKIYWLLLLLDVVVGLATSKEYTQKFSDRYAGTAVVQLSA